MSCSRILFRKNEEWGRSDFMPCRLGNVIVKLKKVQGTWKTKTFPFVEVQELYTMEVCQEKKESKTTTSNLVMKNEKVKKIFQSFSLHPQHMKYLYA